MTRSSARCEYKCSLNNVHSSKNMNTPVPIHDMQVFAESMSDFGGSSNNGGSSGSIGHVIDLGSETLGDDMGFGLLTNTKVVTNNSSHNSHSGNSGNTVHVPPTRMNASDISIGNLEPLEALSFDMPMSETLPEISVTKESHSGGNGSPFMDNPQTASGPGVHLSAPPPAKRLSPEEEAKEKADMINKLSRLESKGFTISKRFTMDNSHEEIKQEMDRLMDARNLEASIKFQRQMMMGVVTGLELMNNKFNPFDWQLEGWSESVHENVDDYDEVFEELYDKYKTKGNMPPEARLLFMMVGSGFMFHMSNSFFRSKMGNMSMDDILKNNPALAKQMAAAAAQAAGPGFGNFMGAAMGVPQMPQMPQQMPQMPQQMPQMPTGPFFQPPNMPQNMSAAPAPIHRREMKGPSGVDDILQTFKEVRAAEVQQAPVMNTVLPQQTFSSARAALSEIQSVHSDELQSQAGSTGTARTANGGRKRKAQLPVGNTMTLNV